MTEPTDRDRQLALVIYGAHEDDWDALLEHEKPRVLRIAEVIATARREAIEECAKYLRTLSFYDAAHALLHGERSPGRALAEPAEPK